MTDDTMALRGLLEKSSDADLLREMIGFAAHRVMELEMAGLTGAAPGERSESRLWKLELTRFCGRLAGRDQSFAAMALASYSMGER